MTKKDDTFNIISEFHCNFLNNDERKISPDSADWAIEQNLSACIGCHRVHPSGMMKTFLYQGDGSGRIPQDVEKLIFDSSVRVVPDRLCQKLLHLRQVEFSEGLKEIGVEAFEGCSSLERVSVPSTVESINNKAFQNCSGERFEVLLTEGSLKRIGVYCFDGCISLARISIPSTVEIIDRHTFWGCTALTDVVLSEGLKVIESSAFEGCCSLARITIPSTTESIHDCAFWHCDDLAEVNLSEGLTYISLCAFADCSKLTRIKVPSTVTTVEEGAFHSNPELITVEFLPRVALAREVFAYCPRLLNIKFQQPIKYEDGATPAEAQHMLKGCTQLEAQFPQEEDIAVGSSQRLDESRVHTLCYFSSLTTEEEFRQEVEQEVRQHSYRHAMDSFGMTPFHLLFSASTPRSDLLQVVLDTYPISMLGWKDSHCKRATDYIGYSWSKEWQELVTMAFDTWIVKNGLFRWAGEAWVTELLLKIGTLNSVNDKTGRDHLLTWVCDTIMEFERNETMSLLEMAVWRMHVSQNNAEPMDRTLSLALCMASDVSTNVGSFLGLERKSSK